MFGVDFPEIIVICGVALVVLGPKKLPGAAAKIGRWVGQARSMARQFRDQLEQEISSAENAADIRKEVESVGAATRKQPGVGAAAGAQKPDTPPPDAASGDSVPREAVSHGTAAHEPAQEPMPFESGPYEAGPYQMPPPEGYGPNPQQLTFDAQLHDTALPAEGAASAGAREWMPETQTWMAGAGWEVPDPTEGPARPAPQSTPSTPRQAAAQHPSPHDRAPEPDAATPPSRTEAVEHEDR